MEWYFGSIDVLISFLYCQKLADLEKRLVTLNSGDEKAVKTTIEEFSVNVQIDQESVLNK